MIHQRYRIGDYLFDANTGELVCDERTARLQPQPAQVLAILAERAGGLVSRKELRQKIWPGAAGGFDPGLNYCIRQIRLAFDEQADAPQYLETLPRRGYRLIASVSPLGDEFDEPAGSVPDAIGHAPLPAGIATPPTESVTPGRRPWAAAAIAAGVVTITTLFILGARREPDRDVARIVVLPFAAAGASSGGTSSDDGLAALRNGLLASITAALTMAGADSLHVIGPATTSRIEGGADVEVARNLAGDYVVSGFIGVATDSILAFAQLVRVPGGEHLWARRFLSVSFTRESLQAAVAESVRVHVREAVLRDRT